MEEFKNDVHNYFKKSLELGVPITDLMNMFKNGALPYELTSKYNEPKIRTEAQKIITKLLVDKNKIQSRATSLL
jgi:hypothetical protein